MILLADKKYYFFKLHDTFFNKKEVKKLRKIAGGDTLTIIYLKMILRSLKNDGLLVFEEIEETFEEEIALDIDEEVENVRLTIQYLVSKKLLQVVEKDIYQVSLAKESYGGETASALRVRKHREKQKELLQCNANVTQCNNLLTEKEEDRNNKKEDRNNKLEVEERTRILNNANPSTIQIKLNDNSIFELKEEDIDKLVQVYQKIDVIFELKKLSMYCEEPKNRKKPSDIKKYITNWLNNAKVKPIEKSSNKNIEWVNNLANTMNDRFEKL